MCILCWTWYLEIIEKIKWIQKQWNFCAMSNNKIMSTQKTYKKNATHDNFGSNEQSLQVNFRFRNIEVVKLFVSKLQLLPMIMPNPYVVLYGNNVLCLTNFIWCWTSNLKCHVTFSKPKINVNGHLHFLLECHMPSKYVLFQFLTCQLTCGFFLHKSHYMSNFKFCVCQRMYIFIYIL